MIIFIESDYKTLLLSMLSDYIDSCESIRKAISPVITIVSAAVVCTKKENKTTSATVIRSIKFTPTMRKNSPVTKTNGYIIKRCRSAKFTFCTRNNDNNNTTCISLDATMCKTTVVKCSLQEFCEKVTKTASKCKVLEEIKEECKECNNICMGSDEICTEFIKITMEYCKEEAKSLILQLNKDISPELVNTIILRFIGLQLYLRIIQEFYLLREHFTTIINNLSTCYDAIKSCTCGDGGRCCSTKGKCLCTIFYKLFKATKLLHDRYCKIIRYMKGESDVDLYKAIPSLSLTRSMYLLTKYFNKYIDKIEEESRCGTQAAGTESQQGQTPNNGECTCHKYSSKLDDVMTLLLGGIEDTDDCDGLLSDVISMMSPFVEVEDYRYEKMNSTPSTTNRDAIDKQLKDIEKQKKNTELKSAIPDINGESTCDGTTVGSATADGCTVCSTAPTAVTPAATTQGCNGSIEKDCRDYINNTVSSTGCTGPTRCTCNCTACRNVRVECCCFCKDSNNTTYDEQIKTCLGNLVGLLDDKGIKCNGSDSNGDCLMCYLCVLKCKMSELQKACTVNNGDSNGNLDSALQNLPENIIKVVDNICGNGSPPECCKKCTGQCNESGTCQCGTGGNCCKVNDRYSNFTKFLLGTDTCSSNNTSTNKCKTITKTLTQLNGTLKKFIENGENGSQCNCGGTQTCKDKCCCGTENCNKNGCNSPKPIKILSCVIECGLKGIKERSQKIETHIDSIVNCLECIDKQMKCLENCYCGLHKCISDLGKCVKDDTKCLGGKICKLKGIKQDNQKKFKEVIEKSKDVLSDICGLYRVYYIESYSYSLSPYYDPIFPHNKQFILPCISN